MSRLLFTVLLLLFVSCEDETNTFITNEESPQLEYSINLAWDESHEKSKSAVHVKWDEWITNDSTTFYKYIINKIKIDGTDADIDFVNEISTTKYSISFPAGEFLGIFIEAEYQKKNEEFLSYIYSDTIQFFTQPISPVSNLSIEPSFSSHILKWDSNEEDEEV